MTWMLFWKICLLFALAAFAGMAVCVSIGGALDVRRMLRRLEQSAANEADHDATPTSRED